LDLAEANLPQQYDRRSWPELAAVFAGRFRLQTRAHWIDVFAGTDACVSPVLRWAEVETDEHMRQRQSVIDSPRMRQAAPAPRFSRTPLDRPGDLVVPGSDTLSLLAELGYDEAAIVKLLADKIVAVAPSLEE
jgi:alpha-methylacyl-CoA racemase